MKDDPARRQRTTGVSCTQASLFKLRHDWKEKRDAYVAGLVYYCHSMNKGGGLTGGK